MTYFWHDEQGWWWGHPDEGGSGPYATYAQMMYRYGRMMSHHPVDMDFWDKVANDTIDAPRLVVSNP
jgi:hypothetical protein